MNLHGWLPSRVYLHDDKVQVEWMLLGQTRLQEPFYEDTLRRLLGAPFHHVFRRKTSTEEMVAWGVEHPGVPLRGLIFHLSRCGSTLLSQQLAELPRNIVASEPAPLDSMLRARLKLPELPRETQVQWVRAVVAALGQSRNGEEGLYIKMDCWDTHEIDLMLEAFPDTPWIFLYREPEEVMIQHQQLPAMWLIPSMLDPRALRLEQSDWRPDAREVYAARGLAKICDAGLAAVRKHRGGVLVNYTELPEAMCGRLLHHFGLREEDIPVMRERGRHDAKVPRAAFAGDDAFDSVDALKKVRVAVATYLQPSYDALEAERLRSLKA